VIDSMIVSSNDVGWALIIKSLGALVLREIKKASTEHAIAGGGGLYIFILISPWFDERYNTRKSIYVGFNIIPLCSLLSNRFAHLCDYR
jgi:hypothetical protein